MALFVQDDITIENPQLYNNISVDNRSKIIRIVIKDIEVNHKLIIERLYINDNICYVNTSRGNYILNTEDPKLHLVFYNKRWFSIGRDNALPLIDKNVDRQYISNNQYQNCLFGENFIQTEIYNTNNGVDTRYYMSDRLFVSAPNYHLGNLGCIFVYSKDENNDYTILEDMITIPYDYRQGLFQGKFGSHFGFIDMNGYHYLIVCAPNRKTNISFASVYIYSYKKRPDNTFYFHHETSNREILIPRVDPIRELVITNNKAFHLIFDKEILTYYISSHNSETIRISEPYLISVNYVIKTVQSSNTYVYLLSPTAIVKYSFPDQNLAAEGPLEEITEHISDLSGSNILSFRIDASGGIVSHSDDKVYFYDSNGSHLETFTLPDSPVIQSFELFQNDPNKIILLTTNKKIYRITDKNQLSSYIYANLNTSNKSRIKFYTSDEGIVRIGIPEFEDGNIIKMILIDGAMNTNMNFKNDSNIQPEISVSDDAENVYIYDRRTKIISVLLRNEKNIFILSHTIIPDKTTQQHLRFLDTILAVKINYNLSQILIGVKPYNNVKSCVLVLRLEDYFYLSKWTGNSIGYGKYIDVKTDIAVVSDPDEIDIVVSNVHYAKGLIDLYNLKPASNFAKLNTNPLRSTSQIGKVSKMSSNLNEIVSIGEDNSLTMFSNIYDLNYRRIVVGEKISDVEYFMEGKIVQTNKDLSNHFYRYQKVNGCFEIITKREIDIQSLSSINSKITILPLGKNYTFFYYTENIVLFDIRDMKLVKTWTDTYTTNVSVSIDGSTISYVNQTSTHINYIVCS